MLHRASNPQRLAEKYIRTQEDLDKLLAQFSATHKRDILERLRPHLPFEPKPLDPQFLLHLPPA